MTNFNYIDLTKHENFFMKLFHSAPRATVNTLDCIEKGFISASATISKIKAKGGEFDTEYKTVHRYGRKLKNIAHYHYLGGLTIQRGGQP